MTDLIDRGIFLILGIGIGFILGYMTRSLIRVEKGIHHVEEIVERDRGEGGFMHINRIITDVLYLFVLGITLFGVYRAEIALNRAEEAVDTLAEKTKQDEIARCEAGQDSRNAQRDIVDAVYTLAAGFAVREEHEPPRTAKERVELTLYLERLDRFRSDTYEKIVPSHICVAYVTDDNEKPEPIDIPGLKN